MTRRIEISDPSPPSRESLIRDLTHAAEIEHGITCQYLFSAFSIRTQPEPACCDWPQIERLRHFKSELLSIAREEMAHHGLVLNLLILLGGAPHFQRRPFPCASRATPPFTEHHLLPFGLEALERFARYEELHTPGMGGPEGDGSETIGDLYQKIRDDLATVHGTNPRLFIGGRAEQITNQELRIRPGQFDVQLLAAHDLPSAQALLDSILHHDHHDRVEEMRQELGEMLRLDPAFQPSFPVVRNPSVLREGGGVHTLTHPWTRRAAYIFNKAYEAMILLLTRLYGRGDESNEEVDGLIRTAFFPLMTAVIRPLGELLTLMPADDSEEDVRAGACFEPSFALPLGAAKRGTWVFVHEALMDISSTSATLCRDLEGSRLPWASGLSGRFRTLHENLQRITMSFESFTNLRKTYVRHTLGRLF